MGQGQEQNENTVSELDVRIMRIVKPTTIMGDIRGIVAIETNGYKVDVYGSVEPGVFILGGGQVVIHELENLG